MSNYCYYCHKPADRAPYHGQKVVCEPCKKKWAVTIQEEQQEQQQGQQPTVKDYWTGKKKR
jgi:hypothetical protein